MNAREMQDELVNDIINDLETGKFEWFQQWESRLPASMASMKSYRGMNLIKLMRHMHNNSFSSPYYATYNRINAMGGRVKKGSKGTTIVYYAWKEKIVEVDGEQVDKGYQVLYPRTVFNLDQTTLEDTKPDEPLGNEAIDKIVSDYGIVINGGKPSYSPLRDEIYMPSKKSFTTVEEYYSTLFHELIHSTGHKSRLNRTGITGAVNFGSDVYSREELVAEFGRVFMCAETGLKLNRDNSLGYIQHWASHLCKSLKENKNLLKEVCNDAQKGVMCIMGD